MANKCLILRLRSCFLELRLLTGRCPSRWLSWSTSKAIRSVPAHISTYAIMCRAGLHCSVRPARDIQVHPHTAHQAFWSPALRSVDVECGRAITHVDRMHLLYSWPQSAFTGIKRACWCNWGCWIPSHCLGSLCLEQSRLERSWTLIRYPATEH